MDYPNSSSMSKSHHLGYGYKPRSKLDLYNPREEKQANQEVVAFLDWLDQSKSITNAFDDHDNLTVR